MKNFMDENFLLTSKVAEELYHKHAKKMPIFDYHNHLSPKEIYENKKYSDLAEVWLGGDHYKWRAMRTVGVEEKFITGDTKPYEKYVKWAETVPDLLGNPLYHWTHLELQRYFGIDKTLTPKTADEIWETVNAFLATKEYDVRGLIQKMNIAGLGTTDDPIDDLRYHKALKAENYEVKVLPTFRPDKILDIEKPTFIDYVKQLGTSVGYELTSIEEVKKALVERLDYFVEVGCKISDVSLGAYIFLPSTDEEVSSIYKRGCAGEPLNEEDYKKYHGYLLAFLGREYNRRKIAMQLHMGAIRNNSARMYKKLGADCGFDSIADYLVAEQLSGLLSTIDETNELPKTIFYNLNPADNLLLVSMAGNYQGGGIPGKIQFGTAWWFCDNLQGMRAQLEALCQCGVLSKFVGMLTDSRSFLSFPRHEYFRRILCEFVGNMVVNGEYPNDMEYLGQMIENICFNNAAEYFGLEE